MRTFEPEVKEQVRGALERIAQSVAQAHRCTVSFEYADGYATVVNDRDLAELVAAAAGPERLVEVEAIMGGEDFSAYQQVVPGCFFVVGGGGPGSFRTITRASPSTRARYPVAIDVFERTALAFLAKG